jgi:glycosyltransferase involved in cell wall biosynthesis
LPTTLRVAFYTADQNPARDRSLGITGYTDGLIRALLDRKEIELTTVGSRSSYAPPLPERRIRRLPIRTDKAVGRLLVDNLHPVLCRSAADIWHYPKGHLSLVSRPQQPVVGTVHDLIVNYCADHYPEARSGFAYAYWSYVLKRSIPRFDVILTVSKFSENAVREFCDRFHLRCPPIHITYEGPGLDGPPRARVRKQNKVVHLASEEVHKRTATLLEFWKKLQSVEKDLPTLKIIGRLRESDRSIAAEISNVEIGDRLPRAELEVEIATSRALLFFSEIEGFGLPALEAYLLGTPVVYVRATAVEEILGERTPGGFSLNSFESFQGAFGEAIQMAESEVAEKAEALRKNFSWSNCAERTVAVYRSLL